MPASRARDASSAKIFAAETVRCRHDSTGRGRMRSAASASIGTINGPICSRWGTVSAMKEEHHSRRARPRRQSRTRPVPDKRRSGTRRTCPSTSSASTMAPRPCAALATAGTGPIAPPACQMSGTWRRPRARNSARQAGLRPRQAPTRNRVPRAPPSAHRRAPHRHPAICVRDRRCRFIGLGAEIAHKPDRREAVRLRQQHVRPMTRGFASAILRTRSARTWRRQGQAP